MSELDDFAKELLKVSEEISSGKEAKKFLKKEANKLKTKTLNNAKTKVKAHSGNYFKSIKAGNVYDTDDGLSVDAYSASSLAHLIEKGHIIKGKNKKDGSEGDKHGFKKGYYVFDNTAKDYKEEFEANIENFKNELFKKNGF